MGLRGLHRWFFALITLIFCGVSHAQIDLNDVIDKLKSTEGIVLEVHGIVAEHDLFVGTYRKDSFFNYLSLAITTEDANLREQIGGYKRHDFIRVWGDIPPAQARRGMPHIVATRVQLVKSYEVDIGRYERRTSIPQDLIGRSSVVVKVHAIDPTGRMLVVDYQGAIVPVRVPRDAQATVARLSRGDIVEVFFEIGEEPAAPTHLELRNQPDAVRTLDSVAAEHGQPAYLEGDLVMFPESPQVRFNVFALQRQVGDVVREYTIVNFSDPELFAAIRQKLQNAWDQSPITPKNDRNKLIKKGLRVLAVGKYNFVDPSQANPQVLLERVEDITVLNP
jgi:hypothetical protein